MPQLIKRWVVCWTGFGQGEHRMTGVEMLQDDLHVQCSCPHTRVILKSWHDSPSSIAARIKNRCGEDLDPAIVIIGYSWGGYSAVLMARELRRRGLTVDNLLLADAVWRSRFFIGYPLSLLDKFAIMIPSNVKQVHTWRQTSNTPRGAKIIIEDPSKTDWVTNEVLPHIDHQYVDDHRPFLLTAKRLACPR